MYTNGPEGEGKKKQQYNLPIKARFGFYKIEFAM